MKYLLTSTTSASTCVRGNVHTPWTPGPQAAGTNTYFLPGATVTGTQACSLRERGREGESGGGRREGGSEGGRQREGERGGGERERETERRTEREQEGGREGKSERDGERKGQRDRER